MKIIIRMLITTIGLLSIIGCNDTASNSKIHDTGFIYCESGDFDTFNPQISAENNILEAIGAQLYDRLLTIDPITQQPSPNLAKQWHIDETGTVYTFTLQSEVAFHRTELFTPTRFLNAEDVVFSFNRILNPEHPYHETSSTGYPWFDSTNFAQSLKSITALGPHQVQFILTSPNNAFLSTLATSYAVILSKEYAEQLVQANSKSLIDSLPVGTGPFQLSGFQKSKMVRLKRHQDYWQGKAKMSQVVFDISSRGTGALTKLLRKECDIVKNPILSQLPVIIEDDDITLFSQTAANVAFIAINTQNPLLKDLRVRKALNFAIDRTSLINSVYYNSGIEAVSILPPSSWVNKTSDNHSFIRYNLDYAQRLLHNADVTEDVQLTMWVPLDNTPYNPSPSKTAEIIQNDLAKIGVKLKLITSDLANNAELSKEHVDLILTGWNANSSDPDTNLRPLLSCETKNNQFSATSWCNEEFDHLLNLAKETQHPNERIQLYGQIQTLLDKEIPIIPLAHGVKYQANQSSLQGFVLSPFNTHPFHNIVRVKKVE